MNSFFETKSPGCAVLPRRGRRAFTLVEMLVAMVVLGLLLGLLLQMSTTAFAATRGSHQKIEATEGGRQVLDALGADIATMITQNGIPILVSSTATSPADISFSFVTQTRGPAPSGNTSISAAPGSDYRSMSVRYQLQNGILYRLSQPVTWSDVNLVPSLSGTADPTQGSQVATGILRIDAVALLSDGTTVPLVPTPTGQTWAPNTANGQTLPATPTPFVALNLTNTTVTNDGTTSPALRVRAVTIAVAALDAQNYNLLSSSAKLQSFRDNFASPTAGQTPVQAWDNALSTANWAGVPRSAVAAVQMAQATYPMPQ
jgi:prepilin-type N-terminal cleavage/methylation domain-containing protein